jgi:hypothetical protein
MVVEAAASEPRPLAPAVIPFRRIFGIYDPGKRRLRR